MAEIRNVCESDGGRGKTAIEEAADNKGVFMLLK